jgi:arylsulfatase A-like enzyme
MRYEYASLLSMCDNKLGDVLDLMDELDLWKDTMLIVWTDHGFLLGEHEYWAKVRMPFYEEVSHTPFFVWDPRCGKKNERRQSLVQPSIDLPLTLLDFFGVEPSAGMIGKNLAETIATDKPVRQAGMFGVFGGQVNVTDGRWVYMRATENRDVSISNYTAAPYHMNNPFTLDELKTAELSEPQPWAKNLRLLKFTGPNGKPYANSWFTDDARQTLLYDLKTDPQQKQPVKNSDAEHHMTAYLVSLMKECQAPAAQFARLAVLPEK